MTRAAVGLADLLHALEAVPGRRWPLVAGAFGWGAAPSAEVVATPGAVLQLPMRPPTADRDESTMPETPETAAPDADPTVTHAPRPRFWRVASDIADPDFQAEAPMWLGDGPEPTEDEFDGDIGAAAAPALPLVRPGQVAAFLRRQMTRERAGSELDLPAIIEALVRRRPLQRLPVRTHRRWPTGLQLVYDATPALGPLQRDLQALTVQVCRLLGPRVALRLTTGEPGGLRDADGAPVTLKAAGGPVLVLGDAGLAAGSAVQLRWAGLGQVLSKGGARPLLMAPLPRRQVRSDIASAYDIVLLGGVHALRLLRPARFPRADPAPAAEPEMPALALLRTAMYGNPWITPALLRALRRSLQRCGVALDVGHEAAVWRDPAVSAHDQACTLRTGSRPAAAREWAALPLVLKVAIVSTHWEHLQSASPLVRAEYARALQPLLDDALRMALDAQPGRPRVGLAEHMAQAQALARRACSALWRGAGWTRGLAAYLGRLGQRAPEVIGEGEDALQAAWLLAHRQQLLRGQVRPPEGMRMAQLGWALDAGEASRGRHMLTVYADAACDARAPSRMVMQVQPEGSRPQGATWAADGLQQPWAELFAGPGSAPAWLAAGSRHPLDPGVALEVRSSGRILTLERCTRPDWAVAMRWDRGRWQAELADGRWLTWVPACALEVPGTGLPPTGRANAPGAWWDGGEALQRTPPTHRIERPSWARAVGHDRFGPWAVFEVTGPGGHAEQRLRWMPAGVFAMGSPPQEAGRADDEVLHEVVLSRGFWMADTACTQALWRAVLATEPGDLQQRPDHPVEQVSWAEVTRHFLPALNALVPGLHAELPTEAQWEYACRAGTRTPYAFGSRIAADQVRFRDGPSRTAAGGPDARATCAVRQLPPNAWGLYQMHGNVWEWCSDGYAAYGDLPRVDPCGPAPDGARPTTREPVLAVLRGGGFLSQGERCRSASRLADEAYEGESDYGFRFAVGVGDPDAMVGPAPLTG